MTRLTDAECTHAKKLWFQNWTAGSVAFEVGRARGRRLEASTIIAYAKRKRWTRRAAIGHEKYLRRKTRLNKSRREQAT